MDSNNTETEKKPTTKPKKRPEKKSKGEEGESGEVVGRARAKTLNTSAFDQKSGKPLVKGLTKPIETIGEGRFKNLLGMFDKTKGDSAVADNTSTTTTTVPLSNKINNDKINMFSGGGNSSNAPLSGSKSVLVTGGTGTGGGMSIKERMENMLKLGKEKDSKTTSSKSIDPALVGYKKAMDEQVEEDGDDDVSDEADDLDISDNEDEKKSEKSHKTENSEDNDVKIDSDMHKDDQNNNLGLSNNEVEPEKKEEKLKIEVPTHEVKPEETEVVIPVLIQEVQVESTTADVGPEDTSEVKINEKVQENSEN
jgi:hypothetical protein